MEGEPGPSRGSRALLPLLRAAVRLGKRMVVSQREALFYDQSSLTSWLLPMSLEAKCCSASMSVGVTECV